MIQTKSFKERDETQTVLHTVNPYKYNSFEYKVNNKDNTDNNNIAFINISLRNKKSMVNSTYALRETSSKANSLTNSNSVDYYTEKDPQYFKYEYTTNENPKRKKKKSSSSSSSIKKTKSKSRKMKKKSPSSSSSKKKRTSTALNVNMVNDNSTNATNPPMPMLLPNTDDHAASSADADADANADYQYPTRIRNPSSNDVLCGRGGNINSHPGNIAFRSYVSEHKNTYNLTTNKHEKSAISQSVVDRIHNLSPSGRFLMKVQVKDKDHKSNGGGGGVVSFWVEVDNAKAVAKTSQALREGAPSIRAMAAVGAKAGKRSLTSKSKSKSKTSLSTTSSTTRKSTSVLGKRKKRSSGSGRGTSRHRKSSTILSSSSSSSEWSAASSSETETESRGIGKRARRRLGKRRSYYKDDDEEDKEEEEIHPLIVPMSNGHRGKQLIPRHPDPEIVQEGEKMSVDMNLEEETANTEMGKPKEEEKITEATTSSSTDTGTGTGTGSSASHNNHNPCVSFDEDHDHPALLSHDTSHGDSHSSLYHPKDHKYNSYYNSNKAAIDPEAKTPPPSKALTPTQSVPPLSLDDHHQSQSFSHGEAAAAAAEVATAKATGHPPLPPLNPGNIEIADPSTHLLSLSSRNNSIFNRHNNNGSNDSCNSSIGLTLPEVPPYLPPPPQSRPIAFARAHSLASSELNGFNNESFTGDESFINPFLNEDESKVLENTRMNMFQSSSMTSTLSSNVNVNVSANPVATMGTTSTNNAGGQNQVQVTAASSTTIDSTIDPPVSSSSLYIGSNGNGNGSSIFDRKIERMESSTTHCSIWSDFSEISPLSDVDDGNFYKGVRAIHDITHADITTPTNGNGHSAGNWRDTDFFDEIPTFLIPYEKKRLISPLKSRLVSRDNSPLLSSTNSSEVVKNQ